MLVELGMLSEMGLKPAANLSPAMVGVLEASVLAVLVFRP